MWTLEEPYAPAPSSLLAGTPVALLAVLGVAVAASGVLVALGLPPSMLAVAGVAAGHGGLLATALGWASIDPRSRIPRGAGVVTVGLLALAATAARHPLGAVAYLAPLLWLGRLGASGRLGSLPPLGGASAAAVLAGALAGALLGGHLLLSASRTLGYRVRTGAPDEVLAAIAYDLGANVLSAECFFRGALFDRARRRWSLGAGVLVSTAAAVLRYLVDPQLPHAIEIVVGMVFYVTLLGVLNCWLVRWSGSLLPGFLAALLFFAAYRMLGTG